MFTQSQSDDCALSAQMNNARNISHLLKAIHFKDVSFVFKIQRFKCNVRTARVCKQAER